MLRTNLKSTKGNLINLFLIFAIVIASVAICNLALIIPYVGALISFLLPFALFFVYYFIGVFSGDVSNKLLKSKGPILLTLTLVIVSLTFATSYVVGYFTYPVKVARHYKSETKNTITYSQASEMIKKMLKEEVGSTSILAYAIYSERTQLTAHSYGEYVGEQFDDIDDLGGIIAAVLNIIIHSIPMLLKWLLSDKLHWVTDAGLVGLTFWYLFSILLTYGGWSSARDYRVKNS